MSHWFTIGTLYVALVYHRQRLLAVGPHSVILKTNIVFLSWVRFRQLPIFCYFIFEQRKVGNPKNNTL